MRGNCYVVSEALYHLLGGKAAGWVPKRFRFRRDTHWFLYNVLTDQRLDPTVSQFKVPPSHDRYATAKSGGFLTKTPSKRAKALMKTLVWQEG
jgi:hypothetical protein